MAVKISCSHCKRVLNVSDKAFGRTVPCPVCKQPITVPNKPAAPAAEPSNAVGPACRAGLPGRDEPAAKSSVPGACLPML